MAKKKTLGLLIGLMLVMLFAVQGTVAWLSVKTAEVENTFEPGVVTCQITEDFNGNTKSNVNVKNTGNVNAYIRVRLVTYRVNAAGNRIGGAAKIPEFTMGTGWSKSGDYYYYDNPVAPGVKPEKPLIGSDGIKLVSEYTDVDGGRQVVEVIAEAIQADGMGATGAADAWAKAKKAK